MHSDSRRQRLGSEERREQLLAAGTRLLAERPYDKVSIEEIAEAAGVSRGLLYHYFPTRKELVLACLQRGERQLGELTALDPGVDPGEQLGVILDRFLDFVEQHEVAYTTIWRSRGGGDREIQTALEAGREQRMQAVLEALVGWQSAPAVVRRTPELETALQGWFFLLEGTVLRWLERREFERERLREMLRLSLLAVLGVAEAVSGGDSAD